MGFLSGVPRQGRVGVGYSTIHGVEARPATEPFLTLSDVDRAIWEIQVAVGSGSSGRRKQILGEPLGRATEQEGDFLKRLVTGQLRQGALGGVMADAVAKAAGASGEITRRALMLSGDLTANGRDRDGERGGRGFAKLASNSSSRSFRCSHRRRQAWPRRSQGSSAHLWSGSSTGSASRSIGAETKCGSTPATSTRSPQPPGIVAAVARPAVAKPSSTARRCG